MEIWRTAQAMASLFWLGVPSLEARLEWLLCHHDTHFLMSMLYRVHLDIGGIAEFMPAVEGATSSKSHASTVM